MGTYKALQIMGIYYGYYRLSQGLGIGPGQAYHLEVIEIYGVHV